MRQMFLIPLCILGVAGLSACQKSTDAEVQDALKSVNVIDASNLTDLMLTNGDPAEAVAFFQRSLQEDPTRIDMKRGLAKSLVRAQRPNEAVAVWKAIVDSPDGTNEDKVGLAEAHIRANDWNAAQAVLNNIPPTHETYDRYRLEAMVADSKKDWKRADSFYETAAGLTTKPAGTLNNWGYSKLVRSDFPGAERLFVEALNYDKNLFTAKNNLVLARAAQRRYDMPIIPMTQVERAQLMYTAALTAIKQGDVTIGKGLLEDAIETHPQHFEEAVRALEALSKNVAKT